MSFKMIGASLIIAALAGFPKPASALSPALTVIAAPGLPATCATETYRVHGAVAFPAFCQNVEQALLSNGPFDAALQHARRIHAVISFAALPSGRVIATLVNRSSGDALIDRSLLIALAGVRAPTRGNRTELFAMPILLQAVDNTPAVVFHVVVK